MTNTFELDEYIKSTRLYKLATLSGGSTNNVRPYFLGVLKNGTDNFNHLVFGVNAWDDPDPEIIMSLSTSSVYFFGVRNPIVPVGSIQ